ncbi:hypothetical protein V2J09_005757 [Rumex salicifolius]
MELVSLPTTVMRLYVPERLVVVIQSLVVESSKQEQLLLENVPDPLIGHTWPIEMEMDEADKNKKQRILKKKSLPRGTSNYQGFESDEDDGSLYLRNFDGERENESTMILYVIGKELLALIY